MVFKSSLFKNSIIEIVIINHSFSKEEYLLTKKVLEMYSPGLWIPMGINYSSLNDSSDKRLLYLSTLELFQDYIPEWAFSKNEINLIKDGLNHFISLPLPLYENIQVIRERKYEKEIAKSIISYLEESLELEVP